MKSHVKIGHDMMKNSHKKVFRIGSLIALASKRCYKSP